MTPSPNIQQDSIAEPSTPLNAARRNTQPKQTKQGRKRADPMSSPTKADNNETAHDATTRSNIGSIVSPWENSNATGGEEADEQDSTNNVAARRALFPSSGRSLLVSPSPSAKRKATPQQSPAAAAPAAKRRLIFGKYVDLIQCATNVSKVYKIVKKLTGSIGGNGYCGPIYGELTMGSMQKMVDLMIEHTQLDSSSAFIDVGSGIGKPNLHVAQYPGVAFSCGVEMEDTRWSLGMTCLKAVLDEARRDSDIRGNTMFLHKNITEAKTFDPFTHVYMFSIGFPPPLWIELSEMWNKSQSPYLICYHGPKSIITSYEFDVELICQAPTSMHGSKEGHMGYIYKRKSSSSSSPNKRLCDDLFRPSWDLVQQGLQPLHKEVASQLNEIMGSGRKTRSSKSRGTN